VCLVIIVKAILITISVFLDSIIFTFFSEFNPLLNIQNVMKIVTQVAAFN